ncbi:MAG: hypothetical protein AB7N76_23730 [Planctomycetota bacterium]
MPWPCKSCGQRIVDDAVHSCPACGWKKPDWTLQGDQTRSFAIAGGKKVLLLRGPREGLTPAEEAVVLPKERARALAAAGRQPAGQDVLTVRLIPRKAADLEVLLELCFEAREVEEQHHTPEGEPDAEGQVDLRVLFVAGEGELAPDAFPGLVVIDLGEDTARGWAPAVEVSALKKKAQRLPTRAAGEAWLSARFFDRSGRRAAAGLSFQVQGRAGSTDGEGVAVLAGLPHHDLLLEFEGGHAVVPAVHDPDVRCRVPLRWLELEGDPEPEQGTHTEDAPLPPWHPTREEAPHAEPDPDEEPELKADEVRLRDWGEDGDEAAGEGET